MDIYSAIISNLKIATILKISGGLFHSALYINSNKTIRQCVLKDVKLQTNIISRNFASTRSIFIYFHFGFQPISVEESIRAVD